MSAHRTRAADVDEAETNPLLFDDLNTTNNTPTATATASPINSSLSNTTSSSNTGRESEPSTQNENAYAPRAKINISLKKKSKPSSNTSNNNSQKKSTIVLSSASTLLADEYTTIAEEAEIISRRRQEEGTVLVIPCHQSKHELLLDGLHNKNTQKQPLLAGRLASLRMQRSGGGGKSHDGAGVRGTEKVANDDDTTTTDVVGSAEDNAIDDETVMNQLIQSAEQSNNANREHSHNNNTTITSTTSTSARRGLVISAPSQNKLIIARRNNDDDDDDNVVKVDDERKQDERMMNDDELFKRELSHHAADVDPTSNVYANVAIQDFGSALLRGMGWTGGPESSSKRGDDETQTTIKPRPHRLGLGATPLLSLPTTSSGERGSSSGRSTNGTGGLIHRRARRPDEVKRDEDRRRQQEEAEKREEEKKRLDVQHTLQKGSIVHVINQDGDATSGQVRGSNSYQGRALVIRTAGVPGLNRILIQMEGSSVETPVTKHSVLLCSWKELEVNPYQREPLQTQPATEKSDRHLQKMLDDKGGEESNNTIARTQSCSKEDKRMKRNYHDRRSRSRSDSRERTSKRRKDTSSHRKHRDDERNYRSRSRSPAECSSSHHRNHHNDSHSSSSQNQQQLHWLIPNIRVRLISKKMPKFYLRKGVVQDVLRSSSRDHGDGAPKATLLMDSGQVLDKVPERYLETALPKTGGNVIILEGTEHVRWKMGRLLERSSKDGHGIIQLEEDLDVVKVSLDSIAEWCG
ncbi:hypothetical protein ACHAWU_003462 [Discostella pseudostelligera]|uniref:Spp2/MOS2 G-patch domain-containing protein n=1 Tax=Discostella pseudostelligera TaxID=259834 RepID=A0ABD3M0Y0_9STRA